LQYYLGIGKSEQNIVKQSVRTGQPIPDAIKNAPTLKLGLNLYFSAYTDLDSERTHYDGPTPIPWTAIKSYAVAHNFDSEETEDLFYFIKAMDNFNLNRISEKLKAK
jgi:hypothetical protein